MTRIDMTTREWHELVKPVLPHRLDDKAYPELAQVRFEVRERSVVAVATDRYTLAAERRAAAGHRPRVRPRRSRRLLGRPRPRPRQPPVRMPAPPPTSATSPQQRGRNHR